MHNQLPTFLDIPFFKPFLLCLKITAPMAKRPMTTTPHPIIAPVVAVVNPMSPNEHQN